MKRIVILLLALLSINLGWAQREVQKTEAIKNADQLYVHFKFADDIKIEQWNKNEIKQGMKQTISCPHCTKRGRRVPNKAKVLTLFQCTSNVVTT